MAAWNGSACASPHVWSGVTCENGRVAAMNFSGFGLEGKYSRCTVLSVHDTAHRLAPATQQGAVL